jgi:hypothetical protein
MAGETGMATLAMSSAASVAQKGCRLKTAKMIMGWALLRRP